MHASPEELNRWLGRESAGEAVQIATESADLSLELKRGLSYVRKHGRAQGRKKEGGVAFESLDMFLTLTAICVAALCLLIAIWIKRTRDRRELELHSITPESLHALLASNQEVLLFDVRQPLDLLADSEIIVGAARIPPKELLENPSLIPRDKDSVVYCTCPGDKTSRVILHRAQAMHFLRVKFLKGGLAGWKAKGYPVQPYEKSFHLDTRT